MIKDILGILWEGIAGITICLLGILLIPFMLIQVILEEIRWSK